MLQFPDRSEVSVKPFGRREAAKATPAQYLPVRLTEEEQRDLEAWIKQHLDRIDQAMAPVQERFSEERNQFDGVMPLADYPYPGAFRTSYPIVKKKTRELVNRAKQAYLDSDPIWAIHPPADGSLDDYIEKMEKAMDDLVRDEMEAEANIAQAKFEAGLHGTGFLVPGWVYLEDERRVVETYHGFDGLHEATLQGMQQFEQRYHTWRDEADLRRLHSQLRRGQTVTREFVYTSPTKNRPDLMFVSCKDVRVYPQTNGFDGLRTTPLYGYVKQVTREQLRQWVDDQLITAEWFDAIYNLDTEEASDAAEDQKEETVFFGTIRYRHPGGQAPVRYHIWVDRPTGRLLRIRHYRWWYNEPDLVPLYVHDEEPGFFKRGIAWDLKDDHIILTVLLCMYLNGVDFANAMRLIAKDGSLAMNAILSKRYSPHIPLPYKESKDEFGQLEAQTAHLSTTLESIEIMRRNADENTGTSALQSGRESPTDPHAPAAKSALLLQQIEPNLKEYIRALAPGMRQVGQWILWLYYQGIGMQWIPQLPGVPEIPADLLPTVAAQLHPRALLFEYDRNGQVERNNFVVQLIGKYFPQDLPVASRIAITQLDSNWARNVSKLKLELPPPPPTPGQPPSPNSTSPEAQATPSPMPNGHGVRPHVAQAMP